jgi:hypothetical protein
VLYPVASKEGAMSYARQLLDTYPRTVNVDAGVLAATIDALSDCAQACTACADDDLSEPDVAELVKCIRLCLDVTRSLLEACAATCRSCGDECERHAHMHEHCRVCAEACRRCEQACREILAAMR